MLILYISSSVTHLNPTKTLENRLCFSTLYEDKVEHGNEATVSMHAGLKCPHNTIMQICLNQILHPIQSVGTYNGVRK